jgi:hypothetical protein
MYSRLLPTAGGATPIDGTRDQRTEEEWSVSGKPSCCARRLGWPYAPSGPLTQLGLLGHKSERRCAGVRKEAVGISGDGDEEWLNRNAEQAESNPS